MDIRKFFESKIFWNIVAVLTLILCVMIYLWMYKTWG